MITDTNNEPITPGQYKYWLPRWSGSVRVTVEERDGEICIVLFRKDTYPTMLKDVRTNAIMERIED